MTITRADPLRDTAAPWPSTRVRVIVAAAAAVLVAVIAVATNASLVALVGAAVVAVALGVPVAVVDATTGLLPDRLVAPMGVAIAILVATAALLDPSPMRIVGVIGAGVVFGAVHTLSALAGGGGGGDAKLAAVIGLHVGFYGLQAAAIALIVPFLLALPHMVVAIAQKRRTLHFGPYLVAGHLLAIAIATLGFLASPW